MFVSDFSSGKVACHCRRATRARVCVTFTGYIQEALLCRMMIWMLVTTRGCVSVCHGVLLQGDSRLPQDRYVFVVTLRRGVA